jgi:Uma2 family endonuclease
MSGMKTVVLGEMPPMLASLVAERKRLGLDRHDEIWNGEYHMAPAPTYEHARVGAKISRLLQERGELQLGEPEFEVSLEFNLGTIENFRIPDLGLHRGTPSGAWHQSVAMVVEVRSPDDESFEKFDFYFAHNVEEILVADLSKKTVSLFGRGPNGFTSIETSTLIPLSVHDVTQTLNW